MKVSIYQIAFFILIIFELSSCKSYQQNILFKTDGEPIAEGIKNSVDNVNRQYRIESGDVLTLEVFTKNGERIIDPDFELVPDGNQNITQNRPSLQYIVSPNGTVKLPMLGDIPLGGLTLLEAEELLSDKFTRSYHDPFVNLNFLNKRVIVLGAPGGQVIPLTNEGINLIEILALAGGLDKDSKAQNIRLIRGDLRKPEVHIIDLSTIEGLRKASLNVESGDIIYVEPIRRVLPESIRDYAPVFSAATSILTLIVVIQNLKP